MHQNTFLSKDLSFLCLCLCLFVFVIVVTLEAWRGRGQEWRSLCWAENLPHCSSPHSNACCCSGIAPAKTMQSQILCKKKRIFWHCTSSSTVSHMRLARAWIHLPGQAATFAVCVTEPRSPAMEYFLFGEGNFVWGIGTSHQDHISRLNKNIDSRIKILTSRCLVSQWVTPANAS